MNRRKRVKRPSRLLRLLPRRPRNRRLRSQRPAKKGDQVVVTNASEAPAAGLRQHRVSLAAVGRGFLAGLAVAAKVVAVFVVLAGVGLGGYYTYQRVMVSRYFEIDRIEVGGTRQSAVRDLQRLVETVRGRNIFTVDQKAISRAILAHPWVKEVDVRRELPRTLWIKVVEHKARALLLMGHLYLVSSEGVVFKRADPDEQEGLPVITGISRLHYLNHPAQARDRVGRALGALNQYYSKVRPALSEVHLDKEGRITFHIRRGGVAVKMGDEVTSGRLGKLDRVWAALGPEVRRARVLFLDNETHADRVTVRMRSY